MSGYYPLTHLWQNYKRIMNKSVRMNKYITFFKYCSKNIYNLKKSRPNTKTNHSKRSRCKKKSSKAYKMVRLTLKRI